MPAMKPLTKDEKRTRREDIWRRAGSGDLALPDAVRDIRRSIGMTQADFARHFGLTRIQVIEIENGKANPTLETLMKIAKPFGFKIGFVLDHK